MKMHHPISLAVAALFIASVAEPATANAQAERNGYILRKPNASISLRLGFARADAGSEVFDFAQEYLTLKRHDFDGIQMAIDGGVLLGRQTEIVFSVGVTSRTAQSNYRDWVDNNDMEIEQETRFSRVPITLGLRYYFTPVMEKVGSFAWVPARVLPYISAGGGIIRYRFEQTGDFVDFRTNDIFFGSLSSSGESPVLYGAAGLQLGITPHSALITELRYDRANAPMSTQFSGFGNIDLSGASLTTGLRFRF